MSNIKGESNENQTNIQLTANETPTSIQRTSNEAPTENARSTCCIHNENPTSGARLLNIKELKQSWTKLLTEKIESFEMIDDGWEFVTVAHWDTALDGQYDADKVTEHEVFGKNEKNCTFGP